MLVVAVAGWLMVDGVAVGRATSVTQTVKPVLLSRIGWHVNPATQSDTCWAPAVQECGRGQLSDGPGGFRYLGSAAADPRTGDVYVADTGNQRVQEFAPDGEFMAMFGWDVNRTESEKTTMGGDTDLCTAVSGDRCGAGRKGTGQGQFAAPSSIAVDPKTGAFYVLEIGPGDYRLDRYTSEGRFLWTVGGGVNAATNGDRCTAAEVEVSHVSCRAGSEARLSGDQTGAFRPMQNHGNLLAVGGPEDLVYVGDEHRVQVFDSSGRWRREIPLVSIAACPGSSVSAITIDGQGDLDLVYEAGPGAPSTLEQGSDVVRRFDRAGDDMARLEVRPREAGAIVSITGLAADHAGRLAVVGVEAGRLGFDFFGRLYGGPSDRPIADFAVPVGNDGVTMGVDGTLYVAGTDGEEVLAYGLIPLAQLLVDPLTCMGHTARAEPSGFACAFEGTSPYGV